MKLALDQSRRLLRERGVWITEACDKCGRLLGAVRWTRRGEAGESCSRECRDGKSEAQKLGARVERKAGRPRLNLSEKCRAIRLRSQQREASRRYRSRKNLSVIKNWQQPIESAELTGAKIDGYVSEPCNATDGV